MGSFFRGDFGQYFTPRVIVKFIVDVLPITNDSVVLDTSCGSGGLVIRSFMAFVGAELGWIQGRLGECLSEYFGSTEASTWMSKTT